MTAEQRAQQFAIDVATLVADTTDIIAHYAAVKRGKKQAHLHHVAHLREQNTYGTNLILQIMGTHCPIKLAESTDSFYNLYKQWKQKEIVDPQLREHGDESRVPHCAEIVWVDCSKFGRMDTKDLDPLLEAMKAMHDNSQWRVPGGCLMRSAAAYRDACAIIACPVQDPEGAPSSM